MNFKDAMTLASDIEVGFDDTNTPCLFVHGMGIALNSPEEIGIARRLEKAMNKITKGPNNTESWPKWKLDYKLTEHS